MGWNLSGLGQWTFLGKAVVQLVHEGKSVHEGLIIHENKIVHEKKIFVKEKMFMKKKVLKNSKIHIRKIIVHRGKSFNFFSKYFLKRVKESPRNVNQPQKSIYQEINRPRFRLTLRFQLLSETFTFNKENLIQQKSSKCSKE